MTTPTGRRVGRPPAPTGPSGATFADIARSTRVAASRARMDRGGR